MKLLIKNEFLKIRKSILFYLVLLFVISFAFIAYWEPYSSLISFLNSVMSSASKVHQNASFDNFVLTEINKTLLIYSRQNIINYTLSVFNSIIVLFAPIIVSFSIGKEYSLKTIRVITAYSSRINIFLSKLITNIVTIFILLILFISCGILFRGIYNKKITFVIRQYFPLFNFHSAGLIPKSNITMQILISLSIIIALTAVIIFINILVKNTLVGAIISFAYLYSEAITLHFLHLGYLSLGINIMSVESKFFKYFENGAVSNFVSSGIYKAQPVLLSLVVVTLYMVMPALFSYLVFKKQDL